MTRFFGLRFDGLASFSQMQKRRIGSLEVSVVGLGCNNFGWRIDAAAAGRVVDAAIEAGVNFFDTADRYGKGLSEEYLGRALGRRRDQLIIATKFGMEVNEGQSGAAPRYVREAIEASLQRLGTDRIDLYQLHRPDPATPIADTLAALGELVRAGKVREIGCSNFSVAQLGEAEAAAKAGARFVSVQNEFSVLERAPENDGVLAECEKAGIGFLPYFPLANGLLTGKYRAGKAPPAGSRAADNFGPDVFTKENLTMVEALIDFAGKRGHTILELAFSWLLAHKPVASVIAGASKPEQARANAAAANWQLNAEELAEVARILNSK
jgi:aryl-alcohol dehydrogenase-like predicted oxidoreductase